MSLGLSVRSRSWWRLLSFVWTGGVDNFNPWAKGYFEMWIIGLPLLIGTVICLANSMSIRTLTNQSRRPTLRSSHW